MDLVLLALVTWTLEIFVTDIQGNQAPEKVLLKLPAEFR